MLVDRNCHQSHHYGLMLAGAMVSYLEAYPLHQYSMYGAVPLAEIKRQLLALRRAGKLDRVKMLLLTNCTFDGIVYDVGRVMEECLAIKPDLVLLVGRGLVRLRPVPPGLPAPHRHAGRPHARRAAAAARVPGSVRQPRPPRSARSMPRMRRCC